MRSIVCSLCLLWLLGAPVRAAPQGDLQLVTCARVAGEYQATLAHRMVLHRDLVASGAAEDEEIRQSIKLQIRNLWGYFRATDAGQRAYRMALSGEEPEITIRRKSAGRYGRDLVIDWTETGEQLALTSPYLKRAAARGRVREGDAAILVDYEARFAMAICGQGEDPGPSLKAALPDDPWLLFWHVPASERRVMRYHEYESLTTPCGAPDWAELPNPEYYWYDWKPDRVGPDARGGAFDCRRLLREGVDYRAVEVPLRAIGRPSGDFSSLRRSLTGPLRATVLIGVVDHQIKETAYAGLRRALLGPPATLAARAAAAEEPGTERGARELLGLLRGLPPVAAVEGSQITVKDGFLEAEVTARLRRSGRPLRLRAYLGLTDVLGPVPPRHWPILWRALAEDNLIVYAGHSGLGENFRLARIEQGVGRSHADFLKAYRQAPFQLVAFLSCYSYMYFGQDLLAASTERAAASSEFVFTAAEYTRGDLGTLGLLDLVDRALAPGGEGPARSLRFLEPQEVLLIKHLPLPGRGGARP